MEKHEKLKLREESEGHVTFHAGNKEMLRLTPEGIYVQGRLADKDTEICQAFKEWFGMIQKEPR